MSETTTQLDLAPRGGDAVRVVVGVAAGALGLAVADWLMPGLVLGGWPTLVAAAVALVLTSALLRPALVWVAVRLGWLGAFLLALLGQAVVVYAALALVPGQQASSFWAAVGAAWVVALVSTTGVWLMTAGTHEAVTAGLLRRARRQRVTVPDPDVPGVVFIQIDGAPYPVVESGVVAGTLPTLSRWVRHGTHRLAEWRPALPATTPASQMGILHGTIDGIPAFRWRDRVTGDLLVANRPADAHRIEALHSDGHGLLADDGVSVSNLFTGDAPTAYATMSAVDRTQETRETRAAVSRFLAYPEGLTRGLSRTVSELVRERFQSSRARRRDVQPRCERPWSFALERAGLNGVMRDMTTSLVADSMLRGARTIYADYVDYDAVAHHAGLLRPESLAALEGVDAELAQLEKVGAYTPRQYHFVVLSDHGQAQGATFEERYGEDLPTVVRRLAAKDVAGVLADIEGAGRLNAVLAGAQDGSVLGRALGAASRRITEGTFEEDRVAELRGQHGQRDELLVLGSGNLGLVYVSDSRRRLTLDELAWRFPGLVPGLAAHPGIAFVVVAAEGGPIAIGADGERHLSTGVVVGADPLSSFDDDVPGFLLRAADMPEAPDIMVNSMVYELGEVAAFEGLVGCHGGLGGWQDRATLVWPVSLPEPPSRVVGADNLHRVLVGWLEHLGHRRNLPPRRPRRYDERCAAPPDSDPSTDMQEIP